jgi:hypothetical protein
LRLAPHTQQVSHRDHPVDKLPDDGLWILTQLTPPRAASFDRNQSAARSSVVIDISPPTKGGRVNCIGRTTSNLFGFGLYPNGRWVLIYFGYPQAQRTTRRGRTGNGISRNNDV